MHVTPVPTPVRAAVPRLYKYSSIPSDEHLARLRVIIQGHELYLPNLEQLNDPADGRPSLAPLSEDQMGTFLYDMLVERSPHLSQAELQHEEAVIRYNIPRHGKEKLQRILTKNLHEQLKDYRIYSMSKRYDNLALWAKYAGDHSGYCLEFANEGPLFERAKNVIYDNSFQIDVTIREHLNGFWFFCKRPEWSNEEEVRLVLARGQGSKVKIDPRWMTRLILGRLISKSHEEAIRDWARQRTPELAVVKADYDTVDQKIILKQ
jgi:hypothetical protein